MSASVRVRPRPSASAEYIKPPQYIILLHPPPPPPYHFQIFFLPLKLNWHYIGYIIMQQLIDNIQQL